ncbi:MAG: hypothetical protein PHX21_02390 [bacterium]|nr:hypothetical protein [bacterium]
MLFMTTMDVIPGKIEDLLYLTKKVKAPDNIKIKQFLKLLGAHDFVVIYEAPNESEALDFVLKFTTAASTRTSLSSPVEGYEK